MISNESRRAAFCLIVLTVANLVCGEDRSLSPRESEPNCTLPPTALSWFRYITFYGWHIAEGNWTNLGESPSIEELTRFHNMSQRRQQTVNSQHASVPFQPERRMGMLELQNVFFQPMAAVNPKLRGLAPRPDGLERWRSMLPAISAAVEGGVIAGFFLGDELVWNNITWVVLSATAATVKTAFPSCFVYYNEGGAPLYAERNINGFFSPYPSVPASVDYVSSDDYDDMWLPKNPEWFYKSFLYPKIKSEHQRVWVVPPVYGWLWVANTTVDSWDVQELRQAQGYVAWIASDSMIAGINGFHLATYPPSDLGLMALPRTLACYSALAQQLTGDQ